MRFSFFQIAIAYRLPRDVEVGATRIKTDSFTETDVELMKVELAKVLPPAEVETLARTFLKLTDDRSQQEKAEGMVSVLLRLSNVISLQYAVISF